ncbi:MAG: phage integrase N-terminal SAM-like domain-containing protein [Leptolyngbyaceae cyanobacterium]
MTPPKPPRLLDQVREIARLKHFSLSTKKSYVHHIRDFILFHDKQHPDDIERARRPQRLLVVFTRSEVKRILTNLDGIQHLIVSLLYSTGMRLMEGLRLRIKNLDLSITRLQREMAKAKQIAALCYLIH